MTDEAERERRRDEINKGWMTVARVADVRAERRDHSAEFWKRPEPEPAPPPSRTFTDAEIARMIRDAVAEQPRSLTADEIERKISIAITQHNEISQEVVAQVLAEERKRMRAHVAKQIGQSGEEFFYLDNDGNKQDAALHNAILNPVDHPIDEKIMAPIRERNRAKWLAEQKAKRTRSARVIDLPALPLRGSRHG